MNEERIRINKFISHNTKYSRREADALIADGQVEINKKTVQSMGALVSEQDIISIKGKRIYLLDKISVIVYNKPKGELVSKKDDRGRATIYDNLSSKFSHFKYAGRLDFASEGLLLLSDSAKVVDAISNSNIERAYLVKVNGEIKQNVMTAMQNGLNIEDSTKGAHTHSTITDMAIAPFSDFKIIKTSRNYSKLKVLLTEGKNREIRRFFGYFNLDVIDLKRISFGWISLNNLPSGSHRYLSSKEYQDLRAHMKIYKKEFESKRKEFEAKEQEDLES
jgi:23S rRNA pseudouridine2605 synthase